MILDSKRVRQALSEGYSAVCVTCKHFWISKDQGASDCGKSCGGPLGGLDFPEYEGPVTNFERFCFVCTCPPDYALRVGEEGKAFGICKRHLRFLDSLKPEHSSSIILYDVRSAKGILYPVGGRYTAKSLAEVMAETEAEWSEK